MHIRLKDLLDIWKDDSIRVIYYSSDGTVRKCFSDAIDIDVSKFVVTKIDSETACQDGVVDVYVKQYRYAYKYGA